MLLRVPTDCRTLDRALEGGIPAENISLLYGEAETGKSTLALQCAVNCARQGYKTLFIDCDGMFSAKRLSQIASNSSESIPELVVLARPSSFQDQRNIIDRLQDYLAKGFVLVVVDTITSLYSVEVAQSPGSAFKLNRELNRQLASLAQTAKTQKVAVLLVSQVRAAFGEGYASIEPVATRVVKFWADVIINMKPTENPQVVKAVLEKPQNLQPQTFYLRLANFGIGEYITR